MEYRTLCYSFKKMWSQTYARFLSKCLPHDISWPYIYCYHHCSRLGRLHRCVVLGNETHRQQLVTCSLVSVLSFMNGRQYVIDWRQTDRLKNRGWSLYDSAAFVKYAHKRRLAECEAIICEADKLSHYTHSWRCIELTLLNGIPLSMINLKNLSSDCVAIVMWPVFGLWHGRRSWVMDGGGKRCNIPSHLPSSVRQNAGFHGGGSGEVIV